MRKKELAKEMAQYILYFEYNDFQVQVFDGEAWRTHIYATAYEFIHGKIALRKLVAEILRAE